MVGDDLIVLVDLLKKKKGQTKEAHLILFEYCNLRCSFCHQDHDSKVGLNSIQEKVSKLIENTDQSDKYIINLTGGELFLDEFDDGMFEEYFQAGKRLLEHFEDAVLVLGTNLVYRRVERVVELIERLRVYGEVVLATSFDPAGRFSEDNKKLFFSNLDKVAPYVQTVNVVITKQNIEYFLKGSGGEEFKALCDNFNVYFDHYIPSQMYEYIQPDEDLISQLYLFLNEHYPNSYPLKDWKQNYFNETSCRSTKIVNKDNVVTTCWSEAGKDSIIDEVGGLAAKATAEANFMDKYNCIACEYYTRCGMRCFLHHSFIADGNDICQIKKMFDVITK